MTLVDAPDVEVETAEPEGPPADAPPPGEGDRGPIRDASAEEEQPVSVVLTSVAAFLAAAAAGWMCAGVFRGSYPRVIGLLGAAIGAGMIGLSYRTRRPTVVQYLAAPVAVLVGAVLMVPDTTGGSANLPSLVADAVRGGGISQPPVPFDPGWKFLLLVLTALIGAGAASLGIGLNRPKVGLLLPIPLIFGAALVQPPSATMVSTLVALVLAIGAMSVAFGVDLAKEGATSGQFEARRLGRGVGVMAGLVAALVALSQLGFLFPEAEAEQVIPPKRPEQPAAEPDREIFTVTSPIQVPWRLGTLDVYRDNAWMTPPFRTSRLAPLPDGGAIPFLGEDGEEVESTVRQSPADGPDATFTATFTVSDIRSNIVPSILTTVAIPERDAAIEYDPRTQMLRLPGGRPRKGTSYTIVAAKPPSGVELAEAPEPGPHVAEFLEAPAAPPEVEELLALAPQTNSFDRLQFLRNSFYQSVVAAGAGDPVDVPPSRVGDMLRGEEASPYEISAAEALLARWGGVPARLGFGYFGGSPVDGDADAGDTGRTVSVRPKEGATWLEAYFEGHGWVPIVGVPPQARSSINDKEKKDDPTVRPTDELALVVYVPIKTPTITLLFELVRYWLYRIVPWLAAGVLFFLLYPGVVKLARRWRRRRWAAPRGPTAQVMVAYAEFRDAMNDFNFGDPIHTPLEFVNDLAPDTEHAELAWLVTRGLWGDLRRDLRPADAEAAEEMAASLTRRVRRANPGLARLVAFGSRASLRDPYTHEIPNLWIEIAAGRAVRRWLRAVRRPHLRRLIRRPAPAAVVLVVLAMAMTLSGCVRTVDLDTTSAVARFPEPLVPEEMEGVRFVREPALEDSFRTVENALTDDGRVFSLHQGEEIQGSLQVATFKPGLLSREKDLRRGVLDSLGGGRFELTRIGNERVYTLELTEQRMLLWFSPTLDFYELVVARKGFAGADELFVRLLAFQRGEPLDAFDSVPTTKLDPRRGIVD